MRWNSRVQSNNEAAPLFIESTSEQLQAAEEENWELVRDMLGHRVGLNIIAEHTTPFESLSESNVEYIEGKIQDGNTEGEMFESLSVDESDLRFDVPLPTGSIKAMRHSAHPCDTGMRWAAGTLRRLPRRAKARCSTGRVPNQKILQLRADTG
ncbi:MAG: hypothetical protein PW734_08290 [Verrucomicrobium sp.]|nr:hypothetical protein [Verrucomicrobium sp.]